MFEKFIFGQTSNMIRIPLTSAFRTKAATAISLVVIFALTYLLLFALSIACFLGLGYIAILILKAKIMIPTIAVAIGLLAAGGFIVYFMIKFVFSPWEKESSDFIEVNLDKEPQLQKLLLELTSEVGTRFPKKVFLSHTVNASVFYDSSFWSMFFPVRKNLHIGMGLVNGVTVSEFKGILAHEFGHFSQRSMAIGTYVHNANKVIHNVLYENDSYHQTMSSWSNSSVYFKLVSWVAFVFNSGVQFVLKKLHASVNKANLALSREMEFHADAVAASVVGTKPMIDSLLRLNLVSESMDEVINHYNGQIADNRKPDNLFDRHTYVISKKAEKRKIPFVNQLPQISPEVASSGIEPLVRVKDLWASHPSDQDRIASYHAGNHAEKPTDSRAAGTLFSNLISSQEEVTAFVFKDVAFEKTPVTDSLSDFKTRYDEISESVFPESFNGYYDSHNPMGIDLDMEERSETAAEFFGAEKMLLHQKLNALRSDLSLLHFITENPDAYRNFEFEGGRYGSRKAPLVADLITQRTDALLDLIRENDQNIYQFLRKKAREAGTQDELRNLYADFYRLDSEFDGFMEHYNQMQNGFSFAYSTLPAVEIHQKLKTFLAIEKDFRQALPTFMETPGFREALSGEASDCFSNYLETRPVYFNGESYDENAIGQKDMTLHFYLLTAQSAFVEQKKKLLRFQAGLLD